MNDLFLNIMKYMVFFTETITKIVSRNSLLFFNGVVSVKDQYKCNMRNCMLNTSNFTDFKYRNRLYIFFPAARYLLPT